ncbi:MAG: hypothetical protein DRJ42_25530 [Deltaproteobacteria bacterium]|nr:MAG: hypothetical protein DRJ42_25530 [Deltaproteobacteria bacterium]
MKRYAPLDDAAVSALRAAVTRGDFPGVSFEVAMQVALSDGIVPEDGLPTGSVMALDDWLRDRTPVVTFTTTDLKNRTGEVLSHVRHGQRVVLTRHGRPIAELRPIASVGEGPPLLGERGASS